MSTPINLFPANISPELINAHIGDNMVSLLNIEIVEVGNDFIKGKMPVNKKTHQPFGLLHGGASVTLAESLGSMAANLCVDNSQYYCVGLDINANHIRAVREGYVYGLARALHIGKTTQVWEIKITDEQERLVCMSRLTMAVINRNKTV